MTDVPLEFAPSPAQAAIWSSYIIEDLGTDTDGWWMGWCPLHDSRRDTDVSTAQFNFLHGVMRCEADVSCHAPKRGLSLQNVLTRMAVDANG